MNVFFEKLSTQLILFQFVVYLFVHLSKFKKKRDMTKMYETFSKLGYPRVAGRSSHLPTNSPFNTYIRSH